MALDDLLRNKREKMLGLAPKHGALKERFRYEQGSGRLSRPRPGVRALAGLRDVLIDQDEGVDLEKVWAIVEGELPGLREAIPNLLPPLDQLEREPAGEDEAPEST